MLYFFYYIFLSCVSSVMMYFFLLLFTAILLCHTILHVGRTHTCMSVYVQVHASHDLRLMTVTYTCIPSSLPVFLCCYKNKSSFLLLLIIWHVFSLWHTVQSKELYMILVGTHVPLLSANYLQCRIDPPPPPPRPSCLDLPWCVYLINLHIPLQAWLNYNEKHVTCTQFDSYMLL